MTAEPELVRLSQSWLVCIKRRMQLYVQECAVSRVYVEQELHAV